MTSVLGGLFVKPRALTVHRSPTVGLGIVMKEAMVHDPDSNLEQSPCLIITALKEGGPAIDAGVKVGDFLTSVGDPPVPVTTFDQFGACVMNQSPVILHVVRGDDKINESEDLLIVTKPLDELEPNENASLPDETETSPQNSQPNVEDDPIEDVDAQQSIDDDDSDDGYIEEEDLLAEEESDYVEGSFDFEDESEVSDSSEPDNPDSVAVGERTPTRETQPKPAATEVATSSRPAPPVPQRSEHSTHSPSKSRYDPTRDEPLEILWRGTKTIAAGQVGCRTSATLFKCCNNKSRFDDVVVGILGAHSYLFPIWPFEVDF